MKACNENIKQLLEQVRELLFLADKGDMQREDDGCGVLFGIVRDSAYKIRLLAEQEKEAHKRRGVWAEDEQLHSF